VNQPEPDEYVCPHCGNVVLPDDDFCTHCGEPFADGLMCAHHPGTGAAGVCIVCAVALCAECGKRVNDHFLCNHHSTFFIYDGMVGVYGTGIVDRATAARRLLEDAGLHPVLFSARLVEELPDTDYSLIKRGNDDEISPFPLQLTVPCEEVTRAETLVESLRSEDQVQAGPSVAPGRDQRST